MEQSGKHFLKSRYLLHLSKLLYLTNSNVDISFETFILYRRKITYQSINQTIFTQKTIHKTFILTKKYSFKEISIF